MRRIVLAGWALLAVQSALGVPPPRVLPGLVAAKLQDASRRPAADSLGEGLSVVSEIRTGGWVTLSISPGQDPFQAAAALKTKPGVAQAEPVFLRRASAVPDDTLYATNQWNLSQAVKGQSFGVEDLGLASHIKLVTHGRKAPTLATVVEPVEEVIAAPVAAAEPAKGKKGKK